VDLSDDALALARENAARLGFAERVSFEKSDLLSKVDGPLHLIVANLPYIPSGEMPGLDREVLREPHTALDGGADGLGFVRPLIAQAAGKLAAGGRLALELHLGQPAVVAAMLGEHFRDICTLKDHSGRERFVFATRV
jgi:release factor glutamine methyltransferase